MNDRDEQTYAVTGLVDASGGALVVRTDGYRPGPADVTIPPNLAKRLGLRRGDLVTGQVRPRDAGGQNGNGQNGNGQGGRNARRKSKNDQLVSVETVNDVPAERAGDRPDFTSLTPLYPQDRLRLETEVPAKGTKVRASRRVIDLIAPIGRGQRGLIVAPPKTGKTMILQDIASAITTNDPDVHLMVLLVDERPEEVTDMRRSVHGEVIDSTFDRPPEEHVAVAELTIERAKRLVEQGHDVVLLVDAITRLARAYNNVSTGRGRTLSGGVDASAVYGPKAFLGAARNIEGGGSLTILATALVETGSKADDYFFEEFKSTGNMELRLNRRLAEQRIFPAIDVAASGTRHEELLFDRAELDAVRGLRRALATLSTEDAATMLRDKVAETGSNAELLLQVRRTTPLAA